MEGGQNRISQYQIDTISFSPGNEYLVGLGYTMRRNANMARTVWIWNTKTGNTRTRQLSETTPSRGEFVVASESIYHLVKHSDRLWIVNLSTGLRLRSIGHADFDPVAYAFSPDNKLVVTADSYYQDRNQIHEVQVWDTESRTKVHESIKIYEAQGDKAETAPGQVRIIRSVFPVTVLAICSDKRATRVITGEVNNRFAIWDAETAKIIHRLNHNDGGVQSISFSPDCGRVATAANRGAKIWESESGKLAQTLEEHDDAVMSAAFSPDGDRLITASRDRTARIWDVRTGTAVAVLGGHLDAVLDAVFSADSGHIVTASRTGTVTLWPHYPTDESLLERACSVVNERVEACNSYR